MSKIKYYNHSKVKDNKFIKKRKTNIEKIYSYLDSRNFNNYLKPIALSKKEEVYPFIQELHTTNKDKANDLIYLTADLHNKTTTFQDKNIENIKERYETTIDTLNEIFKHYSTLQDEIEEHIYMAPAELLLMNNISKIYYLLNISRFYIEKYYESAEKVDNERYVLNHGNLNLSHLLESNNKFLISWNRAKRDLPVYDLAKLIKNDSDTIEITSIYEIYQSRYHFTKEEEYLFVSLICIPPVVNLDKSNFINTQEVRKEVDYVDKILDFVLKEYEEYQKANQEKLEE